MTDLTELNTLERYLQEHDIPYRRIDDTGTYSSSGDYRCDRHQIMVYKDKNDLSSSNNAHHWIWNVRCQHGEANGSYGHEQGLLELSGLLIDKTKTGDKLVEGYLFASDIIERLEKEAKNGYKKI